MKIAIQEQQITKQGLRRFAVSVVDEEDRCFYHICVTNEPTAKLLAAALELLIRTEEGRALIASTQRAYWNQRRVW